MRRRARGRGGQGRGARGGNNNTSSRTNSSSNIESAAPNIMQISYSLPLKNNSELSSAYIRKWRGNGTRPSIKSAINSIIKESENLLNNNNNNNDPHSGPNIKNELSESEQYYLHKKFKKPSIAPQLPQNLLKIAQNSPPPPEFSNESKSGGENSPKNKQFEIPSSSSVVYKPKFRICDSIDSSEIFEKNEKEEFVETSLDLSAKKVSEEEERGVNLVVKKPAEMSRQSLDERISKIITENQSILANLPEHSTKRHKGGRYSIGSNLGRGRSFCHFDTSSSPAFSEIASINERKISFQELSSSAPKNFSKSFDSCEESFAIPKKRRKLSPVSGILCGGEVSEIKSEFNNASNFYKNNETDVRVNVNNYGTSGAKVIVKNTTSNYLSPIFSPQPKNMSPNLESVKKTEELKKEAPKRRGRPPMKSKKEEKILNKNLPENNSPSLNSLNITISNSNNIANNERLRIGIGENLTNNPKRPTFLSLKPQNSSSGAKENILGSASFVLPSPETPRGAKNYNQMLINGNAYTYLGFKISTKSSFTCLFKPQPMFVPQETDPKLSMYSNWQPRPRDPGSEELFKLGCNDILINSRSSPHYTVSKGRDFETLTISSTLSSTPISSILLNSCKIESQVSPKLVLDFEEISDDEMEESKNSDDKNSRDFRRENGQDLLSVAVSRSILSSSAESIETSLGESISSDEGVGGISRSSKMRSISLCHSDTNFRTNKSIERQRSHSASISDMSAAEVALENARIRIMEGGFESNEDYTYVRGRGRGRYVCESCGIRCKKPSMLRKHLKTHTDLRPYTCKLCNFSFKTKGNLTKHQKSKSHHKKCIGLGIDPNSSQSLEMSGPPTSEDNNSSEESDDEEEDDETDSGEEIVDNHAKLSINNYSNSSTNSLQPDKNSSINNHLIDKNNPSINNALIDKNMSSSISNANSFPNENGSSSQVNKKLETEIALSLLDLSQLSRLSSSSSSASSVVSDSHIDSNSPFSTKLKESEKTIKFSNFSSNNNMQGEKNEQIEKNENPTKNAGLLALKRKMSVFGPPERKKIDTAPENVDIAAPIDLSVNKNFRAQNMEAGSEASNFSTKNIDAIVSEAQNFKMKNMKIDNEASNLRPKNIDAIISEAQNLKSKNMEIGNESQNFMVKTMEVVGEAQKWEPEANFYQNGSLMLQRVPNESCENKIKVEADEFVYEILKRRREESSSSSTNDEKNCDKTERNSESNVANSVSKKLHQPWLSETSLKVEDEKKESVLGAINGKMSGIKEDIEIGMESHEAIFSKNPQSPTPTFSGLKTKAEFRPPSGAQLMLTDEGKAACDICGKTFARAGMLTLHMNIHYLERPFRCEPCGVSFRTKGHLIKHRRSSSHDCKVYLTEAWGVANEENPRPFKCPDCKIAFRIHGHLAKHLRSKMHIMRMECLGKLPFGIYFEMEKTGLNLNEIDTTDCDMSLVSLQSLAKKIYGEEWRDKLCAPIEEPA